MSTIIDFVRPSTTYSYFFGNQRNWTKTKQSNFDFNYIFINISCINYFMFLNQNNYNLRTLQYLFLLGKKVGIGSAYGFWQGMSIAKLYKKMGKQKYISTNFAVEINESISLRFRHELPVLLQVIQHY